MSDERFPSGADVASGTTPEASGSSPAAGPVLTETASVPADELSAPEAPGVGADDVTTPPVDHAAVAETSLGTGSAPVADASATTQAAPQHDTAPLADVWAARDAAPAPVASPYAATPGLPYAPPSAAPQEPFGDGGFGPTDPYGPVDPAPRSRGPRTGPIIAVATVLALLAGLVGGVLGFAVADRIQSDDVVDASAVLPQPPASGNSERPQDSIAGIAAQALPAVVSLSVRGLAERGTGSGFVIREDGYILTNNHVIEAAASGGEITAAFEDGTTAPATIVGRDPAYDLAVVKVDKSGLPVLPLGNSDDAVVGDTVIAVGSPLGLSGTVTAGIVSALNRPVTAGGSGAGETSFINAIQTDAAINPGNSGGPLLDSGGRVIGINSAIATLGGQGGGQGGSIGVGFAIPVNQAKITAEQIIRTGQSTKPVIGVTLDLSYSGPGARISANTSGQGAGVVPGGPADSAGLQPGDVVLEVNGRPVNGGDEFIVAIRAQQPGDTVTLTVERDGSTTDLQVTLGSETSGE
jgi:putative serine protease PepD